MSDEPNVPPGLKIERTPSGGFRFELPRPAGALIGAILAVPFLGIFVVLGLGLLISAFAEGKTPAPMLVFLCFFFAIWSGVPLLILLGLLRAAFGKRALEVDDRAIARCLRLPPLPESRKVIALEEIAALAVDESRGSKGGVTRYLAVKTARKEHKLAEGLDREALEWLAARVAMLADRARGPGAAALSGGKTLTQTLEADLLRDKFETGEVAPEDLAKVDATEAPPEGAGIEVLGHGRDRLAIRLAGRGGGFFLFFATFWLLITGAVTAGFVFGGALKGKEAFFLVPFFALFWAIGIGVLLVGLRQRTLVERLEFRPGSVCWEARSLLGTSARTLSGDLKLSQAVSYEQNYQPVYHLRVTAADGQKIKFAGNLKREAQVWLLAHAGAALGAGAVDLPGAAGDLPVPVLPEVKAGEAPPAGSGIEILEQGGGRLRVRLAGRKDAGLLVFSIVWDAAITFMAGIMIFGGEWFGLLFLVPFYAVGVGLMIFAIRQRTLVEEVSVGPDGAQLDARSALGKSGKRLGGRLSLERASWASSGNTKYYQLVLKDPLGGSMKFAGTLKPEAQLWLMARMEQVLGAANDGS